MLYGVRLARKIVSQPAMAEWAGARAGARARRAVRRRADRLHPQDPQHRLPPGVHGADGPRRRPRWRSLDPRLRVRGVQGLRVADGSAMPFLPAINPCITTMMIGEKCAEMMIQDARRDDAGQPRRRRAADRGAGHRASRTSCCRYPPFDALGDDGRRARRRGGRAREPSGRHHDLLAGRRAGQPPARRAQRRGRARPRRAHARPARRRRAVRAGLDAVRACPPASPRARTRTRPVCRIPADVARATAGTARGAALPVALAAGPRAPGRRPTASRRRDPAAPAGARRSCAARWWSCAPRHDDPRRRRSGMTAAGATCVVVEGRRRHRLGILTDRDLRTRVVADGCPPTSPSSAAMTAPAVTVAADRSAATACWTCSTAASATCPSSRRPARSSASSRTPTWRPPRRARRFTCARRIARAPTVDALVAGDARAAPDDRRAAPRARRPAAHRRRPLGGRRRAHPAAASTSRSPTSARSTVPFAWLALGSLARREALPGSDVDSAIAWSGRRRRAGGRRARAGDQPPRRGAGWAPAACARTSKGTTAANPLLVRSLASWQRAARSWLEDPTQEQALILVSVRRRQPHGVGLAHRHVRSPRRFRAARSHPALLRLLARFSLSYRPPTGFLRGLVVEHSGEHRGRLDLKHGGLVPIVDLARWAGMAAGVTSASTPERLRAAAAAGTLSAADAAHAGGCVRAVDGAAPRAPGRAARGRRREPDDYVDPAALSPLTRSLPQGGLPRGGLGAEARRRRTGGRRALTTTDISGGEMTSPPESARVVVVGAGIAGAERRPPPRRARLGRDRGRRPGAAVRRPAARPRTRRGWSSSTTRRAR